MRRPEPVVCFVSASSGNVFFRELLEALRGELEAAGVATRWADDHFPAVDDAIVYVVVAHEYLPLTLPAAHPSDEQLARTIAIETEQPGTAWFEEAAAVAARCAVTLDINHLGVAALRRRGIDARFLRFGYVRRWDRWGGDMAAERPIDVAFLGGHTPRRAAALARCAGALVERRSALHLTESWLPHTEASPHFLAGDAKWDLLASSRVLVNLHRDELGYFEWQRVIEAMANGCVVVSEHSLGYEPLVAGRHFVSAAYDTLPQVLAALLADDDRQEEVRREAYAFLTGELRLDGSIHVLTEAVSEVLAAAPAPAPRKRVVPRPLPKPLPPPPIEYQRLIDERDALSVMRAGIKQLLLEQRQLRRELTRREPDADEILVRPFGPYYERRPRVSVLVTVYNYEHAVGEALRSVAASTYTDFEVVVVDDGSHDGSVPAVAQTLAELHWVPALQLVRAENAGLAAARNLAAERARGELVFVLDADNAVYPHALERLVSALDGDGGADFAYGMLQKVGAATGAEDLMSWLAWDPLRLRYGNYIDAMAMIRRDALLAVGGYTSDFRLYGWEDFALWCAFAQTGRRGVRVPEIVARYVASVHSMISITNIDAAEAYSTLARAYPFMAGAPLTGVAEGPSRAAAATSASS